MFRDAKRLLLSVALVVSNQAVSEGNQMGDDMEDRVVSTPSGQLQGHVSAKNAFHSGLPRCAVRETALSVRRAFRRRSLSLHGRAFEMQRVTLCHVGKHTQRMRLSGREGSLIGVRTVST